jgi:hypothetical protein
MIPNENMVEIFQGKDGRNSFSSLETAFGCVILITEEKREEFYTQEPTFEGHSYCF